MALLVELCKPLRVKVRCKAFRLCAARCAKAGAVRPSLARVEVGKVFGYADTPVEASGVFSDV